MTDRCAAPAKGRLGDPGEQLGDLQRVDERPRWAPETDACAPLSACSSTCLSFSSCSSCISGGRGSTTVQIRHAAMKSARTLDVKSKGYIFSKCMYVMMNKMLQTLPINQRMQL